MHTHREQKMQATRLQATRTDLISHAKDFLRRAMHGEEVVITYRGRPRAKIIPVSQPSQRKAISKQNDFCGMWKDRKDMEDVEAYVRNLRKGRKF